MSRELTVGTEKHIGMGTPTLAQLVSVGKALA